jgi:dehydrogenase/reductase SDR family member 12
MIRSFASLLFYARFVRRFSALGYYRAARDWLPVQPDFSGQTWLVTGATGGIGRAIALAANRAGARVLAVGRSASKGRVLKADSRAPDRMLPITAELSLLAAIRRLATEGAVAACPIDVLVNNVGVLLNEHRVTAEGLETSFATNLLGPYVLTEALHRSGQLAADGLVVTVASGGMYGSPLRLAPMNCLDPRCFDGMAAYAMHKRAQVELTRLWNRRWQGRPTAHVMHPGWVDTAGVQTALPGFRRKLKGVLRDAGQGADTVLWLAATRPPALAEGGIWLDRAVQPEHAFAWTRNSPHSAEALADHLAQISARLDAARAVP